jgi:hypothetical protein
MSKKLSELLGQPEALVETAVKKLEHLNGFESTDIKLLADINNKIRTKTKELGLDPDDTTGAELFHALRVKLADDEERLNLSAQELTSAITKAHKSYKVYALKHSVAKELLRAHPPRKLMKHLNYRSVDSMIKRENIVELYAGLPLIELPRWQNVFWKDLAKLTPSDFESRSIEIISMAAKRWEGLSEECVSNVSLLGSIAVWCDLESKIDFALQINRHIQQLRAICAYIKYRQVESGFGKNLVEVLQKDLGSPLEISHMPINWKTIFHHYGGRSAADHTEFFGPHILHEDIKAHNPLKVLSKISPVFEWWAELECAIKKAEDGLVSLNLADVIAGSGSYEHRSILNARSSLWHEFIDRYLDHPSVEQHFIQQLEPQTVPIEGLAPVQNPEQEIRQMMELGV